MKAEILGSLMREEKIELFSVLPIAETPVRRPELFSRAGNFCAKSVLIYAVPYYTGPAENLSLYAVSRDYHIYMRQLSKRLIEGLSAEDPGERFLAFADHSPIDERAAAVRAGLGVFGKNGLLITEKYGTLVFLGELFSDADPPDGFPLYPPRGCEGCDACLFACPTGALAGKGECLSALTQRKGELTAETAALLRTCHTVWGCDICQLACPHTRRAIASGVQTPIAFFHEERISRLTLPLLDAMDKETFSRRAFAWRGRQTIRRNLLACSPEKNAPVDDKDDSTK